MAQGNPGLNTLAILIRLFLFWGVGIFFFMFLTLGLEFVTSDKNIFFFILGIMCMVVLVLADWILASNKKSKGIAYGYLQDETLAPAFIVKSKYWNPARICIVTLMLLTIIAGVGVYTQASVVGKIAQASPGLVEGLESENPFVVAFNRTSPATFAELGFVAIIISIFASLISLTGANKGIVIALTGIFGTMLIIVIAVTWHLNAYRGNVGALAYIGFLFGLQAILIVLTGGLIIADIIHIFNNFTLGMMLTVAGTAILKWALPVLFIILFTIWTIDRASFRRGKLRRQAKTKAGKLVQGTGKFLFPVRGG